VENFSGKSVLSVYQDFHAKLFSKNLAAAVASTSKKEILKKSEKFKFVHQVNFAQTLVRQAQLGASYRVPCREVGSPNRAKPNQQPVPSVARLAEPIFANCELYGEQ